jgi:hypothetical protein
VSNPKNANNPWKRSTLTNTCSSKIPLKIAEQVDGVLRHYYGEPRTEAGAKRQVRNLATWLRWALKEDWSTQEIIDWVKLTTFTNCVAWSPEQLAAGKPMVYWRHQGQVADIVKNGLIEMGREDAKSYAGC